MNSQAPSVATGTETGTETDTVTDPDGGSEPTDADLVAAVRAGDTGAHGTLYTRHESGARRLAYTLVHDSADADDLRQIYLCDFGASAGARLRGGTRGVRTAGSLAGVSATATGEGRSPAPPRPGLIRQLWDRFGHLVHELGKFGTVGAIAFLCDLALFNLFNEAFGWEPLLSKTVSTVIAATIAFIGNRFWTWRHRERSGLRREYLLYFFFNAVGLGIALACLGISHYGLGSIWPNVFQTTLADNISAQLVGTALGTLFRFWSYRRFVFVAPAIPLVALPVTDGDR